MHEAAAVAAGVMRFNDACRLVNVVAAVAVAVAVMRRLLFFHAAQLSASHIQRACVRARACLCLP